MPLQFFVLDVVVNFTRPTVDDLFTQLKRIVNTAEEEQKSDAERVGILTSGRRDDWARARMRLMQGKVFMYVYGKGTLRVGGKVAERGTKRNAAIDLCNDVFTCLFLSS